MSTVAPAPGPDLPVRALVVSRLADQGALGLGALVLGRHLGPEAFAPVAALFVFSSLAVQLADHGLSFALLRAAPGTVVATRRLARVRALNAAGAAIALAAAAALDRDAVPWVLGAGLLWCLAAEGYVRRSGWLKTGRPDRVARSEGLAAVAFAVGVGVVIATDAPAPWIGAVFVTRHLVEVLLVGFPGDRFGAGGEAVASGAEWLGQVMTYVAANVDYLVVAALLTDAELSAYVIAFRFASAVPALLVVPIMQQAFVTMAGAAGERPAAYRRLLRRAGLLGGAGIVAVIAAALVATAFLGDGWSDVGPVAAILSVAVPWRMALGIIVATALSLGRRAQVVAMEAGRAATIAVAVLLGAAVGLRGAAVGVTAATVVTITVAHLLVRRALAETTAA